MDAFKSDLNCIPCIHEAYACIKTEKKRKSRKDFKRGKKRGEKKFYVFLIQVKLILQETLKKERYFWDFVIARNRKGIKLKNH